METPFFTGRAVAALAADPAILTKTGKVLRFVLQHSRVDGDSHSRDRWGLFRVNVHICHYLSVFFLCRIVCCRPTDDFKLGISDLAASQQDEHFSRDYHHESGPVADFDHVSCQSGARGGGVGEGVRLHRYWRDNTTLYPIPTISTADVPLPEDLAEGCTSGHGLRA